ncbi:hypothetical protein C2W62_32600 [Candidatus Entotheonella serta]|nr:hypothetical protein C2W62_32600 [Candidatus Entotheonella serta]
MLHICDINNFYSLTGGGVNTYHQNKLAYFRQRGDIRYTLFQPDDHEAIETQGHLGHVRIVHFPGFKGNPPYRYMFDPYRMHRILQQLDPNLIEIGSGYLLPWVVRLATIGTRAVLTGFWHADYPRAYVRRRLSPISLLLARVVERMAWWYVGQTYGRYTATFAAADCVVRDLREHGVPHVLQTPLGVDLDRFHPNRQEPALRQRIGAADGRPVLLFPHRLQEEKGLSTLIQAFPRIYRAHRPVLVVAGDGPRKPALDAFMAHQPDVHYLGYIDDPDELACWYATSDAVFSLSPFETFGLSAAEAMASGSALIAADRSAVREFVVRADCGVMVPYNDADALAARTVDLLGSGRLTEAGHNGYCYATQHFSWTAAFDRMVDYYHDLVASSPFACARR